MLLSDCGSDFCYNILAHVVFVLLAVASLALSLAL